MTVLGDCDAGVTQLCELLGWTEDLKRVIETGEAEFYASQKRSQSAPSLSQSSPSATEEVSSSLSLEEGGGFAVYPKTDCPHVEQLTLNNLAIDVRSPCSQCGDASENWLCLGCGSVCCSRYVKGHMAEHMQTVCKDGICSSFSDFSFWCYACDSYIVHSKLAPIRAALNLSKFGE